MKKYVFLLMVVATFAAQAQVPKVLPAKKFISLRDSTTQIDIVYHSPSTNSLSLDGRNVMAFNRQYLDNQPVKHTLAKPIGYIMWQKNGREYLSGDFFYNDSIGYVVTKVDTTKYVIKLSEQGRSFLQQQRRNSNEQK
jgi:hypothetical protein